MHKGYLADLVVLLTRPQAESEETAALVRAEGGAALLYPCLELSPAADPQALRKALDARPEIVVVTSANAARALLPADLAGVFVAAVGARTAQELARLGRPADLVARAPGAAGLFTALREAQPDLAGKRILFPCAAEARAELPALLEGAGALVHAVVAYSMARVPREQLEGAVRALSERRVDLVPMGSPRTAQVLLDALGQDGPALLSRCAVGAIGDTTAMALQTAGVSVAAVADDGSFAQLLRALAPHAPQR